MYKKTIMFSIESGANNSFIQSHRSAVNANSVFEVPNDLDPQTKPMLFCAKQIMLLKLQENLELVTVGRSNTEFKILPLSKLRIDAIFFESKRTHCQKKKKTRKNSKSKQNGKYRNIQIWKLKETLGVVFLC